jgi:hypothetical protein
MNALIYSWKDESGTVHYSADQSEAQLALQKYGFVLATRC